MGRIKNDIQKLFPDLDSNPASTPASAVHTRSGGVNHGPSLTQTSRDNELGLIRRALEKAAGRPSAAAGILGISPQLLNYKLKKYRINRLEYAVSRP
jgi:arginine utilization regulatory protein